MAVSSAFHLSAKAFHVPEQLTLHKGAHVPSALEIDSFVLGL